MIDPPARVPPPARHIRPIAIGLIRNGDSLLVQHGFDAVAGEHFFRPPGGAIEFGERAVEALRREFREEMRAELVEPRFLDVIENLFEYEGQHFHELVFVFGARFEDQRLYEQPEFTIQETRVRAVASWKPLADFVAGRRPLYPDGLPALLMGTD